jgi:hypothetical protein
VIQEQGICKSGIIQWRFADLPVVIPESVVTTYKATVMAWVNELTLVDSRHMPSIPAKVTLVMQERSLLVYGRQ